MLIFALVANNYNGALKATNELVVFMLELLMLVVYGWYGYMAPANIGLRIGLAAALATAAVILWAVLAAPKSTRRLRLPALQVFRAAMFLLSAFFVYRLGYRNWALVIAMTAIITQIISCFTERQ
jgi:hypothetical protein